MPKDTKKAKAKAPAKGKKANPILEDEILDEEEEATDAETEEVETDEEEAEDDTETDTDEEEVEEEPVKKPAKGSKTGKKSTAKAEDDETDEDNLIQREPQKARASNSVEAQMTEDAKHVKSVLAKEPKVRIFVPLGIGEKKGSKGAYESVTINGYRMVMPKGEYVTVPQSVANMIEAHYNMSPENTEMGEAYRLDRNRVKEDGMSTDEALL